MIDNIKNITVLMSVHNDSKHIGSSIKSILNQSYKDFEFLIIDDGSTDDTEEVINSFKDTRIIYRKIKHSGLAGALNYGLNISNGDWIARIDADDLNTMNRLEVQVDCLNREPHCDVVASWSIYFRNKILFCIKPPSENDEINKILNLHNPINHSSVLFNKRRIIEANGYNENFKCYEDYELWFRLKDKLKFKIIPEFLVYTKLREDSLTKKGDSTNLYNMLYKNAEQKYFFSESVEDKKSWMNILFWTEFFYGNKKKARKLFHRNIFSKKILAYTSTFLPDKIFKEFIDYRFRYRLLSLFEDKQVYKKELSKLLTQVDCFDIESKKIDTRL